MKKFGKIFIQYSIISFLFACATGYRTYGIMEDRVSFAWDPVTTMADGSNIPEDYEIRYCVYVCSSASENKQEAVLVDKYVNNTKYGADTPIVETSCIIQFQDTGTFYLGVRSVAFAKEKPVVCDKENSINRSLIAWSDNKISTNYDPFVVKYGGR